MVARIQERDWFNRLKSGQKKIVEHGDAENCRGGQSVTLPTTAGVN
jgi:hypothetical protein